MLPVVALVGRPNVGKSTLFNRLTRSRDAIVANYSGLTRDRQYGRIKFEDRDCLLIDTGGVYGIDKETENLRRPHDSGKAMQAETSAEQKSLEQATIAQSFAAVDEADIILFMVDLHDGLTASDERLAGKLRSTGKTIFLVANKMDGLDADSALAEFYALGYEHYELISASQGRGVKALLTKLHAQLPEPVEEEQGEDDAAAGTKIAVVGRPNVGKSTLVNRLLGEERVVVFDKPGTTRDSVSIPYERNGEPYTLIDTAGIRKRKNIREVVEKYSIVKALQAIANCHVAILVINAQETIVEQDLHLLGSVIDAGRCLVIAVNKWDDLEHDHREQVKRELLRRLQFIDFADIHFISALHGSGVGKLYDSIDVAYAASTRSLQTSQLTQLLEDAVHKNPPPMVKGRRIKLRYAHAGGVNPPVIVIHGNQTDSVPKNYQRYLEKTFRKMLKLHGTPVKIQFKTGDNPYSGRKNKLTQRQVVKKQRLMKFVKKKKS